jgi:hypothetical protein
LIAVPVVDVNGVPLSVTEATVLLVLPSPWLTTDTPTTSRRCEPTPTECDQEQVLPEVPLLSVVWDMASYPTAAA